jgi:Galactose oxidase, central domain
MLSNSFQTFLNGLIQHSGRQRRVTRSSRRHVRAAKGVRQPAHVRWAAETLEDRLLLSATPTAAPTFIVEGRATAPKSAQPAASPNVQPAFVAPLDPAQMQAAYGVNLISFNGVKGTGHGQTIAIVDAYNDPDIQSDANSFSSTFGLPQFNAGGPTLQVLNETGGTSLTNVPNSTPGGWDVEESLDVEWAHSIAPMANIILFEANSSSFYDLLTAEQTAAGTAGVSTVSNSWASGEFSGEQTYDSSFVTPNGHQGVTFLASTGDDGAPAGYPAYSPNVVAVGGTSLDLNSSGTYQAESAWSGSGGGVSGYETQPTYQNGKVNGLSSTQRTAPDVSIDADPNTGVYVLDSYDGGYFQVGGTSLACPMTAALVSIADQGRVLNGLTTLDGYSQTLPALYSLSSANFHDITVGSNGFSAGTGYDLVTGIGSPIANDLVPALAGYQVSQPASVTAPHTASLNENGSYTFAGSSITATDSAATGTSDSLSLSVIDGTLTLGSTTGLTFTSGSNNASSMTVTGTLANLDAAVSGLVYTPTSLYSGADYLQVSVYDVNDTQTGWGTVNLTVNADTPPTVTAPATATTNENQPYTFSNTISVADADASGNSDSVSLSVSHGYVTLGSVTGLTFTQGLNASSSMTFSGTLTNLNAALAGVVYTPTNGYSGSDSLPISVKNAADNMTGSATVAIMVNSLPAPTITYPSSVLAWENYGYTFPNGQLGITDPEASGSSDSITLSVSKGIISLGDVSGITFTSGADNASSMTITGTLSNLNNAINGSTYAPNSGYTGADQLQLSVLDSADSQSASATVNINVSGTPIVTTPANISLNENSSYTFSNTVSITDDTAPGPVSLAISVADGKLTLASTAGLSFTSGSNGSSSMTVSGSVSALNTALNGLVYAPTTGYSGSDTMQLTVTDPWDNNQSGSGSTSITVIALTPPKITAPASASLNENGSFTFSGTISATDADASGSSDSVSLSVTEGTLTLGSTTGLTFTSGGNSTSSMTVTGTLSNLNAALNGLVYSPATGYSGPDTLQLGITDSGDSLSGSATVPITVVANWFDMTQPVPNGDGVGVTLLLPNGDLLTHGGGGGVSTTWYEVTPDSTGNYLNGTWTQVASMNVGRLYFGSDVLPNGNVFVLGGEYATDGTYDGQQLLSNSAEIYNPTANKWTQVASSPLPYVGDESTEVLPNGNILVGDIFDNGTEIYDPTTNAWSTGPTKVYNDRSDEEGWVKLPNGDILTYDIFASIAANKFLAEIYNPTTNTWSDASTSANGQTLPLLSTPQTGYESGLGIMLPNGQSMWVGTNGNTVFYNYLTNSWTLGPNLPVVNIDGVPTQLTIGDAPGAVLPNGDVLMSLSPAVDDDDYPGPSYIYEFNPTTGVFTNETPSQSQFDSSYNSFVDDMLVLPTGQLFLTNFEGDPAIYTPGGSPNNAWRPTISSFAENQNGTYTLTGTQLNGLDEGAEYGDDNQMAENYPIVRVTDTTTGIVYYATTSNWSSVGVATGSTPETVNVVLPSALGNDPYTLAVIANGISSTSYSSTSNPPGVTAPTTESVFENSSLTFPSGAIKITDGAATGTSDSLTLTVADGKLTLGSTTGLTFTSGANGTSSLTVKGTLANLNAALTGLVYAPNNGYSGGDTLQISVKDSNNNLSGSATVAITVNAIPIVTAPPTADVNMNGTFTFTGSITVTDAAASGTSDSVTLTVSDGTLTLGSITGLTFNSGGNGTSSMMVTGTMTNLNAALNGLVYTPTNGYTGTDALGITLHDTGNSLSGSATVAVVVSAFPPPVVTAPSGANVNENGTLAFPGTIKLTDSGASGTSDSLTLSVSDGKLALASTTGLTVTAGANNSSSMTVTGTLANLNAALNGLVYTPTTGFSGHETLQVAVSDSGDHLSGSGTVPISVNPFVTAPASIAILQASSFTFSSPTYPITLTDGAASGTSESLTLTVLHGKVTLPTTSGLTFTAGANGTASLTVKGTLANLNAALNGLVYTPIPTYLGTDTLTITVADSGDGLSGTGIVAITIGPRKISTGIALGSGSQMMPLDDTTTDDDTQLTGFNAAVEMLAE